MAGFDIAAITVYLVCVNALAFAAFGVDKSRARRGAWRISEKALMVLAIAGGSLGALVGMHVFHHKTRKPLFSIGVPVILAATAAIVAMLMLAGCTRAPEVSSDFQTATVDYVIDGDTVDVVVDGSERRVRLAGIDAPESASHDESLNTPEGALATDYVRGLLPVGRTVYLQKDQSETDKYGRLVRYMWLEIPQDPANPDEVRAKMVNSIIVDAGYAKAYRYWPDIAYADRFNEAQARAVAAGAGVSHAWLEDSRA